jgi:DNA-directed RNA polymerase subunit L
MSSRYVSVRNPLAFTMAELTRLSHELDHPLDERSHTANLCLRRDYLMEKQRRLFASFHIAHPGLHYEDESVRHMRIARDIREVEAALRSVTVALSQRRPTTATYSD